MKNDENLPIRTYRKSELAHLYNPDTNIMTALKILNEWIVLNKELHASLLSTGFKKTARLFTPRQVKLIVQHLGDPDVTG